MYQNINKIYHAAIYVRLSKEDGDIPVQQNWKVTAFLTRKL